MQKEIVESIADRGPDRSRCVLNLLFENHLSGIETAPTWKQLWEKCWKEPLSTLRGAELQSSAKVRQVVYRLREIMDEYFAGEAGQRWSQRATIMPNEYRLQLLPNTKPEEIPDSPFIDSSYPGSPEDEDPDDD